MTEKSQTLKSPEGDGAHQMKILVCDDEPSVRDYVSYLLVKVGHQVETASDGQEALEIILANPDSFDVLITDYRMPRLTGMQLVVKIRAMNVPLKVLMISGFDIPDSPLIDGFLRKPFEPTDLWDCLKRIVY